MKPSREELLFQLARSKPAAKCAAWLDAECEGDAAWRARLEALFAAHGQPETLLEPQANRRDERRRDELHESPTRRRRQGLAELGPPRNAPDEAVDQTLGRRKLLERIGEGECGVVYVTEQTKPGRRRVALKVIKLGMDTKQVVARFEAERQALAMMEHPNIAKVLDAGTTGARDQSSVTSDQSPGGGGRGVRREPRITDPSALTTGHGRPAFVMELVRSIKLTDYCGQNNLRTKERPELRPTIL